MMDGKNSSGRKISLLNDSSDAPALSTKIHLPPISVSARPQIRSSRESSCTSTPSLTPQTPLLVRSDSQDSARGSFATPSPLTPSYASFPPQHKQLHHHHGHQHHQYFIAHHSYSKMDDQNVSMYPPIPDATGVMPQAYPMPPLPQQIPQHMPQQILAPQQPMGQQFRTSDSPASEPSRVSASAQAGSKGQQPKKNQYPCPMAKQVGCTDFFTTSGHAARHAKKHTGKKDAFCPECNKAFTRKDNMEQHRRTHQNGRGTTRTANDDKVKKPVKQQPAKKSSVKPEPHLELALEQQLAEQAQAQAAAQQVQTVAQAVQAQNAAISQQSVVDAMLMPTAGPYFLNTVDAGPIPSLPMPMVDMSIRPPLHRSSFANSLEFVPPAAPMVDPDTLHYSYPSPNGLTNGLNSLALAASEHRRRSEHASLSPSDSAQQARSPSLETPSQETP